MGSHKNALDNLMMAYTDLSGPSKKSTFKGPALNSVKVEKRDAPKFQVSAKARDWSSLAQNLEDAFGGSMIASPTPVPAVHSTQVAVVAPSTSTMDNDPDDWGDFVSDNHGSESVILAPPIDQTSTQKMIEASPRESKPNLADGNDDDDDFGEFVSGSWQESFASPNPMPFMVPPPRNSTTFPAQTPSSIPSVPSLSLSSSSWTQSPIPKSSTIKPNPIKASHFPSEPSPTSPGPAFEPFADFSDPTKFASFETNPSHPLPPVSVDDDDDDDFGDFLSANESRGESALEKPNNAFHTSILSKNLTQSDRLDRDKYGALRDIFSSPLVVPSTVSSTLAPETTVAEIIGPAICIPLAPDLPVPISSSSHQATSSASVPSSNISFDPFGALEPASTSNDGGISNLILSTPSFLPSHVSSADEPFGDFMGLEVPLSQEVTSSSLTDTLPASDPNSFTSLSHIRQTGSSSGNVIPWHSSSPPPPPLMDDEYDDEVVSPLGELDGSQHRSPPGISALNTLTSIDFTLDLPPPSKESSLTPERKSSDPKIEVSPNPSLDQELLAGKIEFHNNPDRYRDLYRITPEEEEEESPFEGWQPALKELQTIVAKGAENLTTINKEGLLDGVESDPRFESYLKNIREIYRVFLRIRRSYERLSTVRKDIQEPCDAIETSWRQILLNSSPSMNVDSSEILHPRDSQEDCCSVCLTALDERAQKLTASMNNAVIAHGPNQYHAPCANFWINCVSARLPALRFP